MVDVNEDNYSVTAVQETLSRTNLNTIKVGDSFNLERAMLLNARLDGHLVQGHVDQTAVCISKTETNGSWEFRFRFEKTNESIIVLKGSICVNGVSLTVVNPTQTEFSVAIIPYTFENTNFKFLHVADTVNLEFDIVGKYIKRLYEEGK